MTMLTPAELRTRARRRLPRAIFDFIDGGAGDEAALRRNIAALDAIQFRPRVLRAPLQRNLTTTLFGVRWEAPIGVAPMGLGNLAWPGTDEGILHAITGAGLAYGLSAAGSITLERAHAIAGDRLWFQLYVGEDFAVVQRLLQRALHTGIRVLMLTVDAAWPGRRLRDARNGFGQPLWRQPRALVDYARHPRWSLTTVLRGMPAMANLLDEDNPLVGPEATRRFMASMVRARLDHDLLARLRDLWPHQLVVKGVLAAEDAVWLKAAGVNGLVISNHGGRQLGSVVTALDTLPLIRSAVGPGYPLLFDSGVRSGEDVAKVLALGADFVLAGRPWLFASAAFGPAAGPALLARQLVDELDNTLAQTGCSDIRELPEKVVQAPRTGSSEGALPCV